MRTLRLRRTARTAALASAALLAGLSLTACQGSGQSAADTSAPVPAAAAAPAADTKAPAEQGAQTSGSEAAADSGSSSADAGSTTAKTGSGTTPAKTGSGTTLAQNASRQADDDGPVTLACHGGNAKVTYKPVSRPLNHGLLTVTNTGSKSCNAYGYPAVRFGEAQSVPPVFEESKPQAVMTLAPGESAYAGVMTNSADGSGTGGYSAKSLTVYFQGRDLAGSTGQGANVPLAKEVYVDSTLTVTYWQSDVDDALMY